MHTTLEPSISSVVGIHTTWGLFITAKSELETVIDMLSANPSVTILDITDADGLAAIVEPTDDASFDLFITRTH